MFASKHVQRVPVSSTTLETFLQLGAPFFPTSVMDFGNLMDTILNLRGKNTATVKVGLWCKSPESIGPECREVWTILWVQYLHTSHFWNVVSSQGARRSKVSSHALDLYARHGTCLHFCTRTSRSNLVLSRQEGMDRWSCSKRILAWINLPRNVIECPLLPLIETSMFILWWVSIAAVVFRSTRILGRILALYMCENSA